MGGKEGGGKLFPVVPNEKIRSNGHKLKFRTFCLNIRKNLFTKEKSNTTTGFPIPVDTGDLPEWSLKQTTVVDPALSRVLV